MNKAALIEAIADQAGVERKQVELVMDTMLDTIVRQLQKGDSVNLTSFGKFSARLREARLGVDPQAPKEKIQIPAVLVPKFKAGKGLKESLKNVTNNYTVSETEASEERNEEL